MDTFGFWTVIDETPTSRADGYRLMCRCACGTEKLVPRKVLKKGGSKSCGCHGIYAGIQLAGHLVLSREGRDVMLRCTHGVEFKGRISKGGIRAQNCPCEKKLGANKRHGEAIHATRTVEYNAWRLMRQRCNLPTAKAYPDYGGRGIKVCDRWSKYENFLEDMGRRPEGMSIDRIDPNGNYEPGNCRWTTKVEQARNKRHSVFLTYCGETRHLKEWAEITGHSYSKLIQRVYAGCSPEEVLK